MKRKDISTMVPEQLIRDIDEREATFSKSTLEICGPNKEQEELLDRICRTYLSADAADKSKLVSQLSNKKGILNCLLGNAYRYAEKLKKTKDVEWLRLGLVSSYLANQKMDYRDVLLAWAELYVVAEEARVSPDQEFLNICGVSDFSHYAVVRSRRSGTHRIIK
jgi:hypothetical protein